MTAQKTTAQEVEREIAALLKEQEVGVLATISPDGKPMASTMHFASDGLVVYCHTFTYTRKYRALLLNQNVSYTLTHLPPNGFHGRLQLRAIQVSGRGIIVTDKAEIERAIEVSHEQFEWLKDANIYAGFKREGIEKHQVFFRIEPTEALWTDHRLGMGWKTMVKFSADGRSVEALAPYEMVRPT